MWLHLEEEEMSWMELSLDVTDEGVDWVYTLLGGTDYTSEINIAKYIEPDLGANKDEWTFTICLYVPCDLHVNLRRSEIVERLSSLERMGLSNTLQTSIVEEKLLHVNGDGINSVSTLIRHIGQRFVVLSPDVEYKSEAANEVILRLKATFAFGSGLHPATMLSLLLIERHIVPEMNALDLGSGSGILSVAMAKLGATVLALDSDRVAVKSSLDAIHRNGVEHQVTVVEGSLGHGSNLGHWMGADPIINVPTISPTASFDIIVANILARVHTALAPDYRRSLRTDLYPGLLITSGFTNDYEQSVTASLKEEGFEIVDSERFNEWVALVFRLKV
jgi:ribosomal protein L11 methyltransferase